MTVGGKHWLAAGGVALGIHMMAAAWISQNSPAPAVTAGGGSSLQVMLSPSAGPSSAEAPAGPRQDAMKAVPAPTAEPSPATAEPVTPPVPQALEPPKPETVAETVSAAEPPELIKPEAIEPVKPTVVKAPAPEVQPVPMPEAEMVEARDAVVPPTPQPRPTPPKSTIAKPAPPRSVTEQPSQVAEAPPAAAVSAASDTQSRDSGAVAGGQPAHGADSGTPSPAVATAGGAADYMSQLRAWLERHKEYPHRARQRRIEGTALLVFVMDRSGRVLSHHIERSAGDRSLDHAVERMIERAQPLPGVPASFQQARLEVRVPVQFMLR
ncbi:TonB-like protein [alpha proteobacterium BAL199]|jgi:periplasmic protein TonB|nr:TonB-like protein [alpha proteobacterium BAL199]